MQTQFQLGSYIHAWTNETHAFSSKSTRFKPYFVWFVLTIIISVKVGINLLDKLENIFHLCMHGCNYPAGIAFA